MDCPCNPKKKRNFAFDPPSSSFLTYPPSYLPTIAFFLIFFFWKVGSFAWFRQTQQKARFYPKNPTREKAMLLHAPSSNAVSSSSLTDVADCIPVPRYHLRDRSLIRRPHQNGLSVAMAPSTPLLSPAMTSASSCAPAPPTNSAHVQPSFDYTAVLPPLSGMWLRQRDKQGIRWPWVLTLHATPLSSSSSAATNDNNVMPPPRSTRLTATQTLVQQVAPAFRQLTYVGTDMQECQLYRTWFPDAAMVPRITTRLLRSTMVQKEQASSPSAHIIIFSKSTAPQWRQSPRLTHMMENFLLSASEHNNTLIFVETERLCHIPVHVRVQADVWLRHTDASVGSTFQWTTESLTMFGGDLTTLDEKEKTAGRGVGRSSSSSNSSSIWACVARTDTDTTTRGLFETSDVSQAPLPDIANKLRLRVRPTTTSPASHSSRKFARMWLLLVTLALAMFTAWTASVGDWHHQFDAFAFVNPSFTDQLLLQSTIVTTTTNTSSSMTCPPWLLQLHDHIL